jgi:hypothetical protein
MSHCIVPTFSDAIDSKRTSGCLFRGKKAAEMKFSTQHTVRVLAGAILLISLGGCGAIDLVATKIGDYKQFKVSNVDFLILDDINAQNIKITMSTSAKTSAFMNNIFTFGYSYPDAPEGKMKSAAVDYLKSTNRNCTIVSDKKVERMGGSFSITAKQRLSRKERRAERRDNSGHFADCSECPLVGSQSRIYEYTSLGADGPTCRDFRILP